jgi:hypothetical protein
MVLFIVQNLKTELKAIMLKQPQIFKEGLKIYHMKICDVFFSPVNVIIRKVQHHY